MQTTKQIQSELDRLTAQCSDLEGRRLAAQTEAGALEDLRRELSPAAFLGDVKAAKRLEEVTQQSLRQAHDFQNLGFAIESITARIEEKRREFAEAARADILRERSELIRKAIDAGGSLEAWLEMGEAIFAELSTVGKGIVGLNRKLDDIAGSPDQAIMNIAEERFARVIGRPFLRADFGRAYTDLRPLPEILADHLARFLKSDPSPASEEVTAAK